MGDDNRTEGDLRAVCRLQALQDKRTTTIRKPDPSVHRDLEWGWLLPILLSSEEVCWGRWAYLIEAMLFTKLPDAPLPRIDFLDTPDPRAMKMLEACLDSITRGNGWRGWGSSTYFVYFLDWLLYAFGDALQKEAPAEPHGCEGASDRLYQIFNLELLLLLPYDYWGQIASEMQYGKGLGFFPTPHSVSRMMAMMTMDGRDCRAQSVCDPAAGTGRLLLEASNYSMRLFAMDISLEMCKCARVNGYMYAPWLVRALPWLDEKPQDEKTKHQTPAGETVPSEPEATSAASPVPGVPQLTLFDDLADVPKVEGRKRKSK